MSQLKKASHESGLQAALWLPESSAYYIDDDWLETEKAAIDWILTRAAKEGADPIVIFDTKGGFSAGSDAPLQKLAKKYSFLSPPAMFSTNKGPVILCNPTPKKMSLAMQAAKGHSLLVLEGTIAEYGGWAVGTKADICSVDASISSFGIPQNLEEDIRSSITFDQDNGWNAVVYRKSVAKTLAPIVTSNRSVITPEFMASFALSLSNMSERGYGNMLKVMSYIK